MNSLGLEDGGEAPLANQVENLVVVDAVHLVLLLAQMDNQISSSPLSCFQSCVVSKHR